MWFGSVVFGLFAFFFSALSHCLRLKESIVLPLALVGGVGSLFLVSWWNGCVLFSLLVFLYWLSHLLTQVVRTSIHFCQVLYRARGIFYLRLFGLPLLDYIPGTRCMYASRIYIDMYSYLFRSMTSFFFSRFLFHLFFVFRFLFSLSCPSHLLTLMRTSIQCVPVSICYYVRLGEFCAVLRYDVFFFLLVSFFNLFSFFVFRLSFSLSTCLLGCWSAYVVPAVSRVYACFVLSMHISCVLVDIQHTWVRGDSSRRYRICGHKTTTQAATLYRVESSTMPCCCAGLWQALHCGGIALQCLLPLLQYNVASLVLRFCDHRAWISLGWTVSTDPGCVRVRYFYPSSSTPSVRADSSW